MPGASWGTEGAVRRFSIPRPRSYQGLPLPALPVTWLGMLWPRHPPAGPRGVLLPTPRRRSAPGSASTREKTKVEKSG